MTTWFMTEGAVKVKAGQLSLTGNEVQFPAEWTDADVHAQFHLAPGTLSGGFDYDLRTDWYLR